jgi:enoyl-[acyl-carrier-protein] reductase (NADH)
VVERAASLDISLNVILHGDVQGSPLAEMELADFERPVVTAVRTMFITTRAAATLLGRAATLEDVGNAAAFAASDCARTMTASALNITCGTEIG